MRIKIIIALSLIGLLAGMISAYFMGLERRSQPPVFAPTSSPYETSIYANGIVESDQANGSNINVYPEVIGPVTQVLVHEGQQVTAGTSLVMIDDAIQRANVAQLSAQAEGALAMLNELKALPRPESLAVSKAQVEQAQSGLALAQRQYDKRRESFAMDQKSISRDAVDTAEDTLRQSAAAFALAQRQLELVMAGAWKYDIVVQNQQYQSLSGATQAATALLLKYTIKASITGVVMSLNAGVGSTVSTQGVFNPYTQGFDPLIVMSSPDQFLDVRCYVDEILVSRLPVPYHIRGEMQIRGTTTKVPLEFVRVQPYVSPKIELSNARQEKVDLRVLPVIFRFEKKDAAVYPGQLVDVYIGQQ